MNVVSFLRARDRSILAGNVVVSQAVRKNLNDGDLYDETVVTTHQRENLEVFLRIKKTNEDFSDFYEIDRQILTCTLPPGSYSMRNVRDGDVVKKKYTFSKIFTDDATQEEIFNEIVKPRLVDFINGQNSTLLTYGASGAGKTYTIVGTDTAPGIIPRALEYVFKSIDGLKNTPKMKPNPNGVIKRLSPSEQVDELEMRKRLLNSPIMASERNHHIKTYRNMQQRLSHEQVADVEDGADVSVSIWVSFAEIYNEQIFDLLQSDQLKGKMRPKLKLVRNSSGESFIKDLTSVSVSSGNEAFQILQYGLHYLQYAATSVNPHSSRSHCIFTIKLVQMSKNSDFSISTINFCDLAGSERVKKTLNKGDRLKESNNINTSLMVLHRCITSIRSMQKSNDSKLIPFRESKLTQLFQKALLGQENICMIVNLNPIVCMFDETQHVLCFSAIAQDIIVKPQPVVRPIKKNRFSEYMQARSTILPPTDSYEDIYEVPPEIQEFFEKREKEIREEEAAKCDELLDKYRVLMKRLEASWLENKKREIRSYQDRIQELERQLYESENCAKRRKLDSSVIILDDSQEGEEDEEDLREELLAKNKKIAELENKVKELEMTLNDACIDYKECEKLLQEKQAECEKLKAEVYALEEQQSHAERHYTYNNTLLLEKLDDTELAESIPDV